jgi:hypothetical protein
MKTKLFLFAVTIFQLAILLKCNAANYYVSPIGSNTNAGTQLSPFKTIAKAASLVTAGSIVHVAAGTYSESLKQQPMGLLRPTYFLFPTKSGELRSYHHQHHQALLAGIIVGRMLPLMDLKLMVQLIPYQEQNGP